MGFDLEGWELQGRYVRHEGRALFSWREGDGKPLLALHGFPSSSSDWRLIAPRLEDRRLIALDFFGFGLSDKSPRAGYSLFDQADAVEAVAAAYGVTRCDLVAHDMGDTVAAELLRRSIDGALSFEIDAAVLTNGSIFIDMARLTSGQKLFLRLPPRALPFTPPLALFRRQLRSLFSTEHPVPDDELATIELLLKWNGGARLVPMTIRYIEERRRHSDRWVSALRDFPGRLAALWGEQDPVAVITMVDRLTEVRPDVVSARWPDVGHWPSLEVPERLATAVDDFLSDSPDETTSSRRA